MTFKISDMMGTGLILAIIALVLYFVVFKNKNQQTEATVPAQVTPQPQQGTPAPTQTTTTAGPGGTAVPTA
jgi:flagellar basal body-associated protein FliL